MAVGPGQRQRGRLLRSGRLVVALPLAALVALMLAPTCGGTEKPERSQASYCGELNRQKGRLQPPPERALDRVYADAARAFEQVQPTAPGEIRADVDAVTRGLHQLAELTAEAEEGAGRADNRRLVRVALSLEAASDRVNAYNKERCGLDTAAATTP